MILGKQIIEGGARPYKRVYIYCEFKHIQNVDLGRMINDSFFCLESDTTCSINPSSTFMKYKR